MKIGMNMLLWTVCAQFDKHEHILDDLKGWGYDAVEFGVDGMTASDIDKFAAKGENIGLDRVALTAFTHDAGCALSPDPAMRQKAKEIIISALQKAEDIGSNVLAGPVYQGLSNTTQVGPTEDEWKWSVDVLRECALVAKEKNIKLAGEPLNRFETWLVNSVQRGYDFAMDVGVDSMGILADTHHSNVEEYDTAKAWEKVMDRIYHVHISENNRGVPGMGHAITPEVFDVLKKSGYDGYLVIEAFNANVPEIYNMLRVWRPFVEDESEVAIKGIEFIKRFV
jgi:D-psicose/D-tagatose/L-ribulose 3-epimerase